MPSQTLTYQADGLTFEGQLFRPTGASASRGGVVVFPEAFGLGEHALEIAEKLSGLGYVALAADYYGGAKQFDNLPDVMAVLGELAPNHERLRARAKAARDALAAQDGVDGSKIAAIGYCFGGAVAIELGSSGADVAAIVGVHSGLDSLVDADLGAIKGRLLLCLGADDPSISPARRIAFEEGLREGGVKWDLHLYGNVVHSFTNTAVDAMNNPSFLKYDGRADKASFDAMVRLFEESLA